jgi:hypothetical protein
MCVTTGSIYYSANREIMSTYVLITPGERQSSGDGMQVQSKCDGVTSLGKWGHPDGANKNRQPCNDEFYIHNNNGDSYESFRGINLFTEILDHDIPGYWEDPGGVNITGEMPQRLDTIETSPHPIFGVIPLNEQIVFQGPGNESLDPQVLWGKREKGDSTKHNFNSYHIPVPSGFNVDLFQSLAEGHGDTQMFELLRYGYPLDVGEEFDPADNVFNHSSVIKFLEQVQKYIDEEMNYGALTMQMLQHLNFCTSRL